MEIVNKVQSSACLLNSFYLKMVSVNKQTIRSTLHRPHLLGLHRADNLNIAALFVDPIFGVQGHQM